MATIRYQNGSGKLGKNLYLVSAYLGFGGYDTYSEFVACADSKDEVRKMHPDGALNENDVSVNWNDRRYDSWVKFADIDKLNVQFIGLAHHMVKGVVLSSFRAG